MSLAFLVKFSIEEHKRKRSAKKSKQKLFMIIKSDQRVDEYRKNCILLVGFAGNRGTHNNGKSISKNIKKRKYCHCAAFYLIFIFCSKKMNESEAFRTFGSWPTE